MSATKLAVGQKVQVGGKNGTIKFIGDTKFAAGQWVGISLDEAVGKNDGTVQGVAYFNCQPNHGIFLRPGPAIVALDGADAVAEPKSGAGQVPAGKPPSKAKAVLQAKGSSSSIGSKPSSGAKAKQPTAAKAPASPFGRASPVVKDDVPAKEDVQRGSASDSVQREVTPATVPSAPEPAIQHLPATVPSAPVAVEVPKEELELAQLNKEIPRLEEQLQAKQREAAEMQTQHLKNVEERAKVERDRGDAEKMVAEAKVEYEQLALTETKLEARVAELRKEGRISAHMPSGEAHMVSISFTVTGIDCAALSANTALSNTFQSAMKEAVVSVTGAGILAKHVTTSLPKEGAAVVTASIDPPSGLPAADLVVMLASVKDTKLLEAVTAAAKAVPSIGDAAIAAGDVEGPRMELREYSDREKQERREVLRLRGQIQVNRTEVELAELRIEELTLRLDEVNDKLNEAMDPEFFADGMQIVWHKEALKKFINDHMNTMQRLKLREGELEREKRKAEEADRDVDLVALTKNRETKKVQCEAVSKECEDTKLYIDESSRIHQANGELTEANLELEQELRSEIERHYRQLHKLEELALFLAKSRGELLWRKKEAEADMARLELRLQTVKAQKDSFDIPTKEAPAPVALSSSELEVVKLSANAQSGVAKATAWAWSLSPQVKDEAQLGQSLTTLTALHRVFRKAQILTCCIHQHYIQDASLAVLQSAAPMEWLCCVCLTAALISYSTAGVLGRLHAAEPDEYKKVIRTPALKSCSGGEKALDAAVSVVLEALMDSLGPRGAPKKVLSNLKALGAQLASIEKSTFKDQPFVSWQSTGCAVEACRASCGLVLYASTDAGGSRRLRWQQLYNRADKIRTKVGLLTGASCVAASSAFEIEPNMLAPPPKDDATGGSAAGPEAEGSSWDTAYPDASIPHAAPEAQAKASGDAAAAVGGENAVGLDQAVLDGLLLQVKALEANAEVEPTQESVAEELDRALTNAEAQLDVINKAAKNFEKLGQKPARKKVMKPWSRALEEQRERIGAAEANAAADVEATAVSLADVTGKTEALKIEIANVSKDLQAVEQSFSEARVEAERCGIVLEQVNRLRSQAQSHVALRDELEREVQLEQDKAGELQEETECRRIKCTELQERLNDLEARIKKKFTTGLSSDEVIALRRADIRQQRDIMNKRARDSLSSKKAPNSELAVPMAENGALLALLEQGRKAESSTASILHDAELASAWSSLRKLQGGLMKEQASAAIVNIGAQDSDASLEAQHLRLQSFNFECSQLKASVEHLMHEAAGLTEQGDGHGPHNSVAFTRLLRACGKSAQLGPMLKVSVPAPKEAPAGKLGGGALPMLANAEQVSRIHRALL